MTLSFPYLPLERQDITQSDETDEGGLHCGTRINLKESPDRADYPSNNSANSPEDATERPTHSQTLQEREKTARSNVAN